MHGFTSACDFVCMVWDTYRSLHPPFATLLVLVMFQMASALAKVCMVNSISLSAFEGQPMGELLSEYSFVSTFKHPADIG